jgi:drug/metabolite transporter (DMT)-like permease
MEDKFVRYSKLYILIFLLFLSIPVFLGIMVGVFYGFSKIISSRPVDFIFQVLILSVPAAVFATAYSIFMRRTKQHPSAGIRIVSGLLFVGGLLSCLVLLLIDLVVFFKHPTNDIVDYHCYSIPFLAANIGCLFFIAIVQAFTTKKEPDWMDRVGNSGSLP